MIAALRNFQRNKLFGAINIIGLAIGMASTLVLALYVINELGFDSYHEKAGRIYRVEDQRGPDPANRGFFTMPPLAPALKSTFPEIEDIVRVVLWKRNVLVSHRDTRFIETNIAMADSGLFNVFTIPFLIGNPQDALRRPNTIILTSKTAHKFFGDTNPVGQSLVFDGKTSYEITGVVAGMPANSHFFFDFLIPGDYTGTDWGDGCLQTYLTLPENYDAKDLEAKFPAFVVKHMGPWLEVETGKPVGEYFKDRNNQVSFHLAPLGSVYLHHNMEGVPGLEGLMLKFGSMRNVILFAILAAFVLVIAAINFINLSLARSIRRTTDLSLRKAMGAARGALIRQFLVESTLISIAALLLALVILRGSIPFFNHYLGTCMTLSNFSSLFMASLAVTLLIGILAGMLPAVRLSSVDPAVILGKKSGAATGRSRLSLLLLMLQFILSIGLIISTATIFLQLRFMNNRELGFSKDHVLLIERAGALGESRETFSETLKRNPGVREVSFVSSVPGRHFEPTSYNLEGRPGSESCLLHTMHADPEFLNALDLKLVSGRNITKGDVGGDLEAVVNEKAAAVYRWKEPVGKRIFFETNENGKNVYAEIVGVIRDFNFQPLYQEIKPMMIVNHPGRRNLAVVRLSGPEMATSVASIQEQWGRMTGGQPFQYSFLDDDFRKSYLLDERRGILFLLFSLLAIFLACVGMLALIISATELKTKEIGIRKVNGATSATLFAHFSTYYLRWIFLAFTAACPLAWFFMYRYLENFAYRVTLSWWIFAFAGIVTLLIALLTITWQNWRMAARNPVELLRYE
jgi:putative ABC transport system permease protein